MKVSDKTIINSLNFLLQRQVHMYIMDNDKAVTIKKGKILNYSVKVPFIQYKMLLENKKIRDFYLNIPFTIIHRKKSNKVIMSYKIEDIYEMNERELDFLKSLEHTDDSKIYDKYLYIEYE